MKKHAAPSARLKPGSDESIIKYLYVLVVVAPVGAGTSSLVL